MRASIVPLGGQRNLLMVTIACSVWLTIHVGQRLRMAEVTGSAQRKVKGHRNVPLPVVRHLELSAHHKIGEPLAPIGVRGECCPVIIIHLESNWRRFRRARELAIAKGRERLIAAIDQWLNQRKALSDFK